MSRIRDLAKILTASTDISTDAEVTSSIASHAAAADPHSVYLKESEFWSAGKNKIINGDFNIWQRGTSFSGNVYTADRWTTQTNKTLSVSQQSFTAGTAPVSGYEGTFFLRQTYSADGSFGALQTKLEDVRLFAGQTITLSYWAKADATYSNTPSILQVYGSGGSAQTGANGTTHNITTSWARYSSTINVPSISGKTIGTSNYFMVQPILIESAGARTIDIWGVQIEAGSVATPFTTATGSLQGELASCQRYYQKSFRYSTTPANNASSVEGAVVTARQATSGDMEPQNYIIWKVQMRIAPSVTLYNVYSGAAGQWSNGSITGSNARAFNISDTAGNIDNTDVALSVFNAVIHYAADAEI